VRPISEVAADMGLSWKDLEPYGRDRAKVPLDAFPKAQQPGKVVVVTAITPTPAGEGKTTTSVGLVQGLFMLAQRGHARSHGIEVDHPLSRSPAPRRP